MKNSQFIVQEREPEFDRQILHRPSFPVNMRLYQSSPHYKRHINGILDYMSWSMDQTWEDYQSNPKGGTYGISGANLGIPYNIIGFKSNGILRFLINPVIVEKSIERVVTRSNCGSIKLKKKIPVKRHANIWVVYYTPSGQYLKESFTPKTGSFTIQHEIDHSNGILITDRYLEQGGDPKQLEGL